MNTSKNKKLKDNMILFILILILIAIIIIIIAIITIINIIITYSNKNNNCRVRVKCYDCNSTQDDMIQTHCSAGRRGEYSAVPRPQRQ